MMKCRDIHEHASEYLESRLSWWGRTRFGLHLFVCQHCRNFIRQMTLTLNTIRGLKKHPDDTAVEDQVTLLMREQRSSSSIDRVIPQ